MVTAPLACIDEFGVMVDVVKDLSIQVEIVHNHFSFFQAPEPFKSEQADVARTRSD
jgi:hypothetical protein